MREPVDNGHKQVGVIVAAFILQHGGDSFEACAGIDVFCAERRQLAVFGAVKLDEDEVPQFDESCAAGVYGAFVAGDVFFVAAVGAEVDVDFAARAAGAGFAHFPEVVFSAEFEDAVGGQRRHLCPEFRGFAVFGQVVGGVARKDGGVQSVRVDAPDVGEKLPGPFDCLGLEVIVEGPVA